MGNIAAFLLSMMRPLAAKVLVSLGFGIISYTGFVAVLNQLTQAVQGQFDSMPQYAAAILGMAGLGHAAGILIGAFAARIALLTTKRLGMLTK